MGHLSLDLPNSIRRHLHELAAAEGVSVEQFVASAITEKVAALLAEDYLRRHAAGASPAAMQAVLDGVRFARRCRVTIDVRAAHLSRRATRHAARLHRAVRKTALCETDSDPAPPPAGS